MPETLSKLPKEVNPKFDMGKNIPKSRSKIEVLKHAEKTFDGLAGYIKRAIDSKSSQIEKEIVEAFYWWQKLTEEQYGNESKSNQLNYFCNFLDLRVKLSEADKRLLKSRVEDVLVERRKKAVEVGQKDLKIAA